MIDRILREAARYSVEARTKSVKPQNDFVVAIGIRKDGAKVISRNSTVIQHRCPQGHAEYRLLRKVGVGDTVFVGRALADGTWAMAKPCKHCEASLRARGIRKVHYTIGPNEYGTLLLK